MVTILEQSVKNRRENSGRKKKLRLENAWLMTWEYMRENRTYIHVSQSYRIRESAIYKIERWDEDTWI
jgi:CRISPR/Cas system CSM-associated protein Csm2 small subunit